VGGTRLRLFQRSRRKRRFAMSGQVGGQVRALPFTGFAALPFLVVGLVISAVGAVMTKLRPKNSAV
jgi:hypothetical protein